MGLRKKVFIITFISVLLAWMVYIAVFKLVVLKNFWEAERVEAARTMQQCLAIINLEKKHLEKFVHDWSSWDETYRFVIDQNQAFIDDNLSLTLYADQNLCLIHVYDVNGRRVWGKTYDLGTEAEIPFDLAEELHDALFADLVLQHHPRQHTSGIIPTTLGPMMVSAHPILTSENEGPSRGSLIMGRLLTRDFLSSLAEQIGVKVASWPLGNQPLPETVQAAVASLTDAAPFAFEYASLDILQAYAVIQSIDRQPAIILQASLPRHITRRGADVYKVGIIFMLAAGVIGLIGIPWIVGILLLNPIVRLTENALSIGSSASSPSILDIDRKDEIGILSREMARMVDRLSKSEEQYRILTENARDVIWSFGLDLKYNFVSPSVKHLRGYTVEEAIKQSLDQILTPESYQKAQGILAKELGLELTGHPHGPEWSITAELEMIRKDGSTVWTEVTLSIYYDKKGQARGVMGITRDISERKRAEQQLLETNMALEKQTLLATEMVARARAANAAKSAFLANMSHEIRTPLNGVIAMIDLMLGTRLTEEQRKYAKIVKSSGEALLALINDILDFSKIEANKLDLEIIGFDLRTVLEDIREIIATKAAGKGLALECLIEPEVPSWLEGDPGRLRQIILNLADNAVKFTSHGKISIRATLDSEDERRATIRFIISDTGIGIPADRIQELFQPFVQADSSTTRKYGGTGLGLSISKQLAQLMGGEIGAESSEDRGSTFWFTAVLKKQSEEDIRFIEPRSDLKGVKVLAIDDNNTSLLQVSTLLRLWGCRFDTVTDGAAALSLLRTAADASDHFAVALIDFAMPDLNGKELGRKIKQDPHLSKTALILMTSMGQRGDAAELKSLGFSGYLTKPFGKAQLRTCLEMVLGKTSDGDNRLAGSLITKHAIKESHKKRLRILIVEDNATNRFVALTILGKLGLQADEAGNGQEAVKSLEKTPYDLILMDCQMPEMDGYEATRYIRRQSTGGPINPAVPIIAMTAHALQEDRVKCMEAGMDDILVKPVQPEEMAQMLTRWLWDKAAADHGKESTTAGLTASNEAVYNNRLEKMFDADDLLRRLMTDKASVRPLLKGFLGEMATYLRELKNSLRQGDAPAVRHRAHTIKGAAANVSCCRLKEIAAVMEGAGKAEDLQQAAAILPGLEAHFEQLKAFMEQTGWTD